MVSLFDFDFEVAEAASESDLVSGFELLKQEFKRTGNFHCKVKNALPAEIWPLLPYFSDRGWLKIVEARVYPNRDFLDYHTPEEAAEQYQNAIEKVLKQDGICWYKDMLPVRNNFGPCDFKTKEDKERFREMKKEITKEAALELGLTHFLNVPSSRGHKMDRFDSKFEKENVLPFIASLVIPMTDYDEIDSFFRNNAFFCGRRDWTWGKGSTPTPPYAEHKVIILSELDIAALTEANDEKTVKLILGYHGGSCTNRDSDRYNILYPPGWSHEEYIKTLTFEDLEVLFSDVERLNRLNRGA